MNFRSVVLFNVVGDKTISLMAIFGCAGDFLKPMGAPCKNGPTKRLFFPSKFEQESAPISQQCLFDVFSSVSCKTIHICGYNIIHRMRESICIAALTNRNHFRGTVILKLYVHKCTDDAI